MNRRSFLARGAGTAAGLGALRFAAGCRGTDHDAQFGALRNEYFKRSLELNPVTSTFLGGDGYDVSLLAANGKLRDYSAAGVTAEVAQLKDFEKRLSAIDPRTLGAPDRVDHHVMNAQIEFMLHQLNQQHYHQRCVDTYVAEPFRGIDWQIQAMTDAGTGLLGTEPEWGQVADRLRAIPAYLEAARANLAAGKSAGVMPDHRMVERDGVNGSAANVAYFRTTLGETANRFLGTRGFAGAMKSRLSDAAVAAATAYEQFGTFLRQTFDASDRTDRFAAGEREYEWRLATCLREGRSPETLFAFGAVQVARYEDAIFRVAAEVAQDAHLNVKFDAANRGASVRAVMDHLSLDSPKNDDELFRWYREVGERAVAYGRQHALFDIPAEYRLDVVPTPPVLRSTIDAAYYPAPPFKKSGVGRFYLTPTGNVAAALKENNRASVADTAIHEGFPGHDWHYKYMTQHAAEISNVRWLTPGAVEDSFSMWEDSMAAEGWALYSEELMAESAEGRPHGFYTAAEHLYELQGQLLRAVRVRVDVGIHTGRMTFDEAIDYFTEHVNFFSGARAAAARNPQARAITEGATRALYRYSKWPTQAITYNLGKNAIVALRDAYKAKLGARYSAKVFHQKFMGMGTIPTGYFRDDFLAAESDRQA